MSVKDNHLIFQCLKCNSIECKKYYNKDCNKELIKRFADTYAMEALIYLFHYREKVFILMNTWIAGKDLMEIITR